MSRLSPRRVLKEGVPRAVPRALHAVSLACAGVAVMLSLGACGGDAVAPDPGPPAIIQRVSGDFQNSDPSQELPRRLTVRVTDSAGVVVPETLVRWTVQGGGTAIPDTGRTDVGGKTSTRVRLSDAGGDRLITAALADNPRVNTVFIVLVSAAPGSGGGTPDVIVEVGDNFFDPPLVTIERGQLVEWRWVGSDLHNVVFMDTTITPRNSAGSTTAKRTGTWQHRFTRLGTFDYGCLVHGFPSQNGRVVVN